MGGAAGGGGAGTTTGGGGGGAGSGEGEGEGCGAGSVEGAGVGVGVGVGGVGSAEGVGAGGDSDTGGGDSAGDAEGVTMATVGGGFSPDRKTNARTPASARAPPTTKAIWSVEDEELGAGTGAGAKRKGTSGLFGGEGGVAFASGAGTFTGGVVAVSGGFAAGTGTGDFATSGSGAGTFAGSGAVAFAGSGALAFAGWGAGAFAGSDAGAVAFAGSGGCDLTASSGLAGTETGCAGAGTLSIGPDLSSLAESCGVETQLFLGSSGLSLLSRNVGTGAVSGSTESIVLRSDSTGVPQHGQANTLASSSHFHTRQKFATGTTLPAPWLLVPRRCVSVQHPRPVEPKRACSRRRLRRHETCAPGPREGNASMYFGTQFFGRVQGKDGLAVETMFFHAGLPLIPFESLVVVSTTTNRRQGIALKNMNTRSVLLGYLQFWPPFLLLMRAFVVMYGSRTGYSVPAPELAAYGVALAVWIATLVLLRSSRSPMAPLVEDAVREQKRSRLASVKRVRSKSPI